MQLMAIRNKENMGVYNSTNNLSKTYHIFG